MSNNLPISYIELFKISSKFGIPSQFISFSNVTFQSDKYICIRYIDPNTEKNSVMIIDLSTQQSTTHKIDAESAIMNPKAKVIALKGKIKYLNFSIWSITSHKS
jgi:clathrin heavy chain